MPDGSLSGSSDRTRVLYIGGWGRSGSTLVGQLLGSRQGCVSVGETRFVWDRGVLNNQLCACGRAFHDCSFWSEVGAAFGGWSEDQARTMLRHARQFQRIHTVPQLLAGGKFGRRSREFDDYRFALGCLYEAIAEVSGSQVVIDSSKDAPYLALLDSVDSIDVRSIHLIRDSRAAAYSWTRIRRRPEITTHAEDMPRLGALRSSREFMVAHLAHELIRSRVPTATMRYEDFILTEGRALDRASVALGWPDVVAREASPTHVDHSISGNPRRFDQSGIVLRLDDEWVSRMSPTAFLTTTVATSPLLAVYGYPLGRPHPRHEGRP